MSENHEESSRKEKRDYLQAEIIGNDYDPEEFAEYLNRKKSDGDDIDQWTYGELVSAVVEYQDKQKSPSKNQPGTKQHISAKTIIDPLTMIQQTKEFNTESPKVVLATAIKSPDLNTKCHPLPVQIPQGTIKPDSSKPQVRNINQKFKKDNKSITERREEVKIPNKIPEEVKGANMKHGDLGKTKFDDEQFVKIETTEFPTISPAEYSSSRSFKPQKIETELTRTAELVPGPLAEIDLKLRIQKHSVRDGGFFGAKQVEYELLSIPCGWKVKRGFQDFQWLRDTLQLYHPSTIIPPLLKKIIGDKLSDTNIMLRKQYIQKFLNELIKNNELKSSDILYHFLIIVDNKQFQLQKKELTKRVVPLSIYDIPHFGGMANISLIPDIVDLCGNIHSFTSFGETLYEKVIAINNQISTQFDELAVTLNYASDIYSELSNNYFAVKCTEMGETMKSLRNLSTMWKRQTQKVSRQFREGMTDFFRYYKNEIESVQDVIKLAESAKTVYLKKMGKLHMKKEKIFAAQDIVQMQISYENIKEHGGPAILSNKTLAIKLMLPKETKELLEKRKACGYYSNRIYSEMQRISINDSRIMTAHFIDIAKTQSMHCTELNQVWADLVLHLSNFDSDIYLPSPSATPENKKIEESILPNLYQKTENEEGIIDSNIQEGTGRKEGKKVEVENSSIGNREELFDMSREESVKGSTKEQKRSSSLEAKVSGANKEEFYVRNYENLFD